MAKGKFHYQSETEFPKHGDKAFIPGLDFWNNADVLFTAFNTDNYSIAKAYHWGAHELTQKFCPEKSNSPSPEISMFPIIFFYTDTQSSCF